MPIEEWLIRTAFAILLLNLFTLGSYIAVRGYYKLKILSRGKPVLGVVNRVNWFRATITWNWMGEEVTAIDPAVFALVRKEKIPLFISDNGMDFRLNIWTHNGKGLMALGFLVCASALTLMFVLI